MCVVLNLTAGARIPEVPAVEAPGVAAVPNMVSEAMSAHQARRVRRANIVLALLARRAVGTVTPVMPRRCLPDRLGPGDRARRRSHYTVGGNKARQRRNHDAK